MNPMAKNLILWVVIALVLLSVFNNFTARRSGLNDIDYSTFYSDVEAGHVKKVSIEGQDIIGERDDGTRFRTYSPEFDNKALVGDLLKYGVEIEGKPPEQQSIFMHIFSSFLSSTRHIFLSPWLIR